MTGDVRTRGEALEAPGGPVLAVLEPAGPEGAPAGEAVGPAGAATPVGAGRVATDGASLASVAARLATELGAEVRLFTWAPGAEVDPGAVATAVAGLVERLRPTAVLLADSDLARQLAPMVARRVGSGAVIGCSDVLVGEGGAGRGDGPDCGARRGRRRHLTFVKPVYGGWLEQEIEAGEGFIPVATLDLSGWPESEPASEVVPAPEILEFAPGASPGVRSLGLVPPDPSRVDLVHARRIVAAGAGSGSGRLLAAARELAELLQGSVGATRPLVDDGRMPKERLIGQTGRTVTPDLYVALGVSGSPHHMAGVRKAEKVLAINRDTRAPIFQFSDVGYVADLEVVLPVLVDKIKEFRDASGGPR